MKEMNIQAQKVLLKKRSLCVSLRSSAPALLLSWGSAHCHSEKVAPRGGESNPHSELCFQVATASHHWNSAEMGFYNTFPHGSCRDTAVWLCKVHQGYSLMVCLDFLVYCFHENTALAVHIPSREMQTSAGKTSHSTRLQVHKSVSLFCLLQMECSLLYLRIWGSDGETK